MMTKSERISSILQKKLLEKTKILIYFDSNVNRDGMKEEKVPRTSVCMKF